MKINYKLRKNNFLIEYLKKVQINTVPKFLEWLLTHDLKKAQCPKKYFCIRAWMGPIHTKESGMENNSKEKYFGESLEGTEMKEVNRWRKQTEAWTLEYYPLLSSVSMGS